MWKKISMGHEIYLISCEFIDCKWKIMLTNLIELWIEIISKEQVTDKCQELNPLLIIEDINVNEIMHEILNNIPQLASHVTTNKIKLETTIEDGVFKYEIDLKKSCPKQLWLEVTMPLCLSIGQLRQQKGILIKEIKRKDEEILEYKSNGAELIRKHIETKPFNDNIIEETTLLYDANCYIDIFQSVINTNQTSKLRGHFSKKEELIDNWRETEVVTRSSLKKDRYVENTKNFIKNKRCMEQNESSIESDVKVRKTMRHCE